MKAYGIDLNKEAFMNAVSIEEIKNSFGKFWLLIIIVQLEFIVLLVFLMLT